MSTFPKQPVRDAELAGEYARKFFGKQGYAVIEERSGGYLLYKVGVVSPHDGEFIEKGGSYYDFADAFAEGRHYISVRDPLWIRWQMRNESKSVEAVETEPEQVLMAV